MTEVQKYKQVKAVINDIPNYMEYQPTKEQNEAFDVFLNFLTRLSRKQQYLVSSVSIIRKRTQSGGQASAYWEIAILLQKKTATMEKAR